MSICKCLSRTSVDEYSRIRLKFKGSCLKQEDKVAFAPKNVVNLFIVNELDTFSRDFNTDFPLKDCLDL